MVKKRESLPLGVFIHDVLVQVARGVGDANKEVPGEPFVVIPNVVSGSERPGIHFDVAVTVSGESGGGGKLSVYAVELGGRAKRADQTVHRVQFEVGLREGLA